MNKAKKDGSNSAKETTKASSDTQEVETPKAAATVPEELTPAMKDYLDKQVKEAMNLLVGDDGDKLGRPSGDIEDKVSKRQRDYIPGKFRKDKTYVPRRVEMQDGTVREVTYGDDEVKYMWVATTDVGTYRNGLGYKMCMYRGGPRSGLKGEGFSGTDLFEPDVQGRVVNGDCYLMWIERRAWDELEEEDLYERSMIEQKSVGEFVNAGYREGIRTYAGVGTDPDYGPQQMTWYTDKPPGE